MRKHAVWLAFALLLCAAADALAGKALWDDSCERETVLSSLTVSLGEGLDIHAVEIDGETWLFLPAFADREAMFPDAEEDGENPGVYRAELDGEPLYVMQSANVRTVFLFSDDPKNKGRAYIENCPRHENRTTGSVTVVSQTGEVDHFGALRQLRGRGNYTWKVPKKAYQIKLEEKADLLKTGERAEYSRTWVLLADAMDGTLLHNRIALDLGLELGMEETPRCEPVDLYYDGEYRGLYLLAEKVEVGEGRIRVDDYEKTVEKWNPGRDLEALPVGRAENRFGHEFSYIEGLAEDGMPGGGSFVLEMESEETTLSDRCWFRVDNMPMLALKSPENASENMVRYVSERFAEACETVRAGGVHPQTGRTLEEDFDVEAFARILLLNEALYNQDAFSYSSSWFILPAGESRFRPGPGWDFDLALRYTRDGSNEGGRGTKNLDGWIADFYRCPIVLETMQRLWKTELEPLIAEVLLGEREGTWLRPLDAYIDEISAACRMDHALWEVAPFRTYRYGRSLEGDWLLLREFLTERTAWMNEALLSATPDADTVTLWGCAACMNVENSVRVFVSAWNHAVVEDCRWEQVKEAEEGAYAQWRLEAVIAPQEGYAFHEPRITFGGVELSYERLENGRLRIACLFDDPSYLPVDVGGEDIGLIYNEEAYRRNYPELSEEYGEDSAGLLEYFWTDGIHEGQMGNAFFLPSEILFFNPELRSWLDADWETCYWEYLSHGAELDWVEKTGRGFGLNVRDALGREMNH